MNHDGKPQSESSSSCVYVCISQAWPAELQPLKPSVDLYVWQSLEWSQLYRQSLPSFISTKSLNYGAEICGQIRPTHRIYASRKINSGSCHLWAYGTIAIWWSVRHLTHAYLMQSERLSTWQTLLRGLVDSCHSSALSVWLSYELKLHVSSVNRDHPLRAAHPSNKKAGFRMLLNIFSKS